MKSALNRKVESQTMEDILSSIRRIIADDQKSAVIAPEKSVAQAKPISSAPEETIDDDILALRSALNAIRGEMDGIQTSISIVDDEVLSLDVNEPLEEQEPLDEQHPEGLVSVQSEQSIRQAFAELSIAANQQLNVEASVQLALRPLLQEWLDRHLPQLVEKLVKEEIERLSGRAE